MKNTVLYLLFFLLSLSTFAQSKTLFEQGNTLYNEGKFTEALDKYETILEGDKHSAELYFNIANAHYKLNHIAPSIYYYEKAAQLNPNDKDIKNNMAFAKNMTIDAIDTLPEVGFSKLVNNMTRIMSFNDWAKLAVGFVIAFVVLFLLYYFAYSTTKKRLYFVSSLIAVFLALFSLVFTFHNYNLVQKNNPAIVFAQEAQVKSEPNLRSDIAFTLHEGMKVQILDTVSNWKKIKLSDGKTGWVITDDVKILNDF